MTIETEEQYEKALVRLKVLWAELVHSEEARDTGWRRTHEPKAEELDELAAAIEAYERKRGWQ
jgi:hypothetical protein